MEHRGYRHIVASLPEFRFGDGLSYSRFRYTTVRVPARLRVGASLPVEATVTNVGGVEADEVVELYLIPPALPGAPRLSLQGVQRLHLKPGESRAVHFLLEPRQLSVVDPTGKRHMVPGSYRISVSGHQPQDPAREGTAFRMAGRAQELPE